MQYRCKLAVLQIEAREIMSCVTCLLPYLKLQDISTDACQQIGEADT